MVPQAALIGVVWCTLVTSAQADGVTGRTYVDSYYGIAWELSRPRAVGELVLADTYHFMSEYFSLGPSVSYTHFTDYHRGDLGVYFTYRLAKGDSFSIRATQRSMARLAVSDGDVTPTFSVGVGMIAAGTLARWSFGELAFLHNLAYTIVARDGMPNATQVSSLTGLGLLFAGPGEWTIGPYFGYEGDFAGKHTDTERTALFTINVGGFL